MLPKTSKYSNHDKQILTRYFQEPDDFRDLTQSAPATNRNIESVFGLMSHFYDAKPNMRVDVRTAFTIIKKNHTLDWLKSLTEQEQDEILTESREALKQLKANADSRQHNIETVILRQMKEKNLVAAKKQAKEEQDRCKYTLQILSLGFWQTAQDIQTALRKLSSEKQKREAICSQLRFRKLVIKQKAPSSSFSVSSGSKLLSLLDLVKKLEDLMGSQQCAQQLLLIDHEYVGRKLRDAKSTKRFYVLDIRIDGAKKLITLQDEDEDDTKQFELSIFEDLIKNLSFIFMN